MLQVSQIDALRFKPAMPEHAEKMPTKSKFSSCISTCFIIFAVTTSVVMTNTQMTQHCTNTSMNNRNNLSGQIIHFIYTGTAFHFSLIFIGVVIVGELLAMLIVDNLPPLPELITTLLHPILLLIISFPILYYFIVRKLKNQITESKQAALALRESEELYRTLVENMPDGVYKSTHDGKFVDVNPAMVKFLGYDTKEELMAIDIKSQLYFEPGDRESLLLDQKKAELGIYRLKKKDGSEIWVEDHGWYSTGENGEVLFHEGILRDVTDRLHEELHREVIYEITQSVAMTENLTDLLKSIHQSLRKVLYAENCFVALHDNETGLFSFPYFVDQFDVNPGPLALLKSCTAYVFRTGITALINSDLFKQLEQQNEVKLIGSPSPSWIGVPLKTPDGTIGVLVLQHYEKENVYSEHDIQFLDSVASQIALAIVRRQTMTEIKLKNEKLLIANAEKDKFFSIIAHDLKGPFNGFLGLTQIMAEELPSLSAVEIRKIAERMRNSAQNLYNLLENLLDWSQIQKGEFPFRLEKIQLNDVVRNSIDMLYESAKRKEIELTVDIADGLVAFADVNMLQTVIRNLVSNAVKFTGKGGQVKVTAIQTSDEYVELFIRDTGIGMSQSMLDDLFRVDVKTSRTGTEGEPSTGLGLLLCKEFIEKNGGKIGVESEVGKGSVFYFTLAVMN